MIPPHVLQNAALRVRGWSWRYTGKSASKNAEAFLLDTMFLLLSCSGKLLNGDLYFGLQRVVGEDRLLKSRTNGLSPYMLARKDPRFRILDVDQELWIETALCDHAVCKMERVHSQ